MAQVQETSLRIGVDSQPMVEGARKGQTALIKLQVEVKQTEKQFEKLEKQTVGLSDIFSGLAVGTVATQFGQLLDSVAKVDSKIKLVTNSSEELEAVYDELLKISNLTGTSLEGNADTFNRLSNATKELGLSYRETLDINEDLIKLLKISGATAAETESVMVQLAQGLGAGALQGDEFRSVAEAMPKLLDLVTDELNRTSDGAKITRGELKELASEGKITADVVVSAFQNASDQINEDFEKIAPTIESSFQTIKNNLSDFVRDVNRATNASGFIAGALSIVADNVGALAGAIAGLTTVIAGQLVAQLTRLSALFLATPIGRLTAGFIALTTAIGAFGAKTRDVAGVSANGFQIIEAAFLTVGDAFDFIIEKFENARKALVDTTAFQTVFAFIKKEVTVFGQFIKSVFGLIGGFINGILNTFRVSFILMTDGFMLLVDAAKVSMANIKQIFLVGAEFVANKFLSIFGNVIEKVSAAIGKADLDKQIRDSLSVDFGGDITGIFDDISGQVDSLKGKLTEAITTNNLTAFGDAFKEIGEGAMAIFNENLLEITGSAKKQKDGIDVLNNSWSNLGGTVKKTDKDIKSTKPTFNDIVKSLEQEIMLLKTTGVETEKLSQKFKAMDTLNRKLTQGEEDKLNGLVETRFALSNQKDVTDDLTGSMNSLINRLAILNSLQIDSSKDPFGFKMLKNDIVETKFQIMSLETEAGLGGFKEGFMLSLNEMTEGLRNWKVEAGNILGDFFTTFSTGFADTIGKAIWDTDNLGEALKSVARDAISQLVSSLIQVGIKMAANTVLGNLLSTKATAMTIAQATAASAAWATPAALASLATVGANAISAQAGIASTLALTNSLVAFRDGGFVTGTGTSTSDSILARLSNGEFVVNAKATSRNRDLLEAMNDGQDVRSRGGGNVVMNISTPNADSFLESQNQILNKQNEALKRSARRAS